MGVRPRRSEWQRCRRPAFVLACVVILAATAMRAADAADALTVVLDQAQIMKLPDRVATIVIGNPLIADVSNIIALDRAGATLMSTTVEVVGPRDAVIVYRGMDRESYACAPKCERRITLGDAPPYFDANLGQAGTRNTQAAAGGAH